MGRAIHRPAGDVETEWEKGVSDRRRPWLRELRRLHATRETQDLPTASLNLHGTQHGVIRAVGVKGQSLEKRWRKLPDNAIATEDPVESNKRIKSSHRDL